MKNTAQKLPVVVQDPENPVEPRLLAEAIVAVSEAAQALLAGPLKRRAIQLLIRDYTSSTVSMRDIELVLDAAAGLAKEYVK